MIDAIQYCPTKIIFGKDAESQVGVEIAKYSRRALLHFGGSSFRKYGLHETVTTSLKDAGVDYVEFGGVKPNPRASLIYEGIALCRKESIDFILAVGGGSVIDSAKAIGIGVPWHGDFFDFFGGNQVPKASLKVGTILTIPGSGSESGTGAIVTHEEKKSKVGCAYPIMAPVFSILNPALTCTVNRYYTACGIVDAISHVLERYFTNTSYVDCTDRIGEGLLKTLMKYAMLVKDAPNNYDIRAEIMWACKLAHDNTAGFGRKHDWSSHAIAHAIGALYHDFQHGAILAAILPAWMEYTCRIRPERLMQFGHRVFGIDTELMNAEQSAASCIALFRQVLKTIGMPATLRDVGIADNRHYAEVARRCVEPMKSGTIGNFVRLSLDDIVAILELAH